MIPREGAASLHAFKWIFSPGRTCVDFGGLTFILLPIGLGLLGFVEPCTIGGHLMFLETQNQRGLREKIRAVLVFILVRASVAGLFGAMVAYLGRGAVTLQTGFWLVFGAIYLILGSIFLFGRAGLIKRRIDLAPAGWKKARSPVVLGAAFGLNIPACAAPILFALIGLAATTGTALTGFGLMFLFGLFLSLPLLPFAARPRLAGRLEVLGAKMRHTGWLIGAVFILLGLWSIWFGLYVNPADWAGQ